MNSNTLRNKLHKLINSADDRCLRKLASVIESDFDDSNNDSNNVLTDQQLEEVRTIAKNHESGNSKSYSWSEVKDELVKKHGLQA